MEIVILDLNTLTIGDLDFSSIEQLGKVTYYDSIPDNEIVKALKTADAVLINKAEMTREIMSRLPKLKYIGLFATGYNNVDTVAAREFGIGVANIPGYSTDSVAQHVFAFIFMHTTNIHLYNDSVHRGEWVASPTFAYFPYYLSELSGKTLGVVGFGAIGRKVAEIGNAIGMKIIVSSRRKYDDCPYEQVTKERLFSESDFISLNCPLTPDTKKLVNSDTLSLMKKNAFIVNTSRGGVIDSIALAKALNTGRIAGAGIDVLEKEPMEQEDVLLKAKNCIITPHIGWATIEARRRCISEAAENLKAFIDGKTRNIVN